jgi:serine/threonine protein phosphatase PrpC
MLEIAYTMHRGKVSRQQQDCLLVNEALHQAPALGVKTQCLPENEALLAIADGVYSSPQAQRASRTVLEALAQVMQQHPERLTEGGLINGWHVRRVQERLANRLAVQPDTYGSSTTIAVAQIQGSRAAILNVGDSRVYQAKANGQWQRVSKDHTVLQGLIDKGQAVPGRDYASLYGMLEYVLCADHESEDFALHRVVVTLEPGDWLVLCSDGVHDELGEERMWALFDPGREVGAQAQFWRDAIWKQGARDNFSLIGARVAPDAV